MSRLRDDVVERYVAVRAYRESCRRYCWDVDGLAGIRLAPFHLLASEGKGSVIGMNADRSFGSIAPIWFGL